MAYSSASLTIGLSNSDSNPVLSNILIASGESIMLLIILYSSLTKYGYKQYKPKEGIIKFLWNNWYLPTNTSRTKKNNSNQIGKMKLFLQNVHCYLNRYALIVVIFGGFYWLFFAWSVQLLDIAIASIAVETWIIVFVLLRYFDKKNTGEEKGLSKSVWILFIFSLLGVIYITLSHTTVNQSLSYKGLLLLIVCVVLSATRVERSIKWAEQISPKWQKHLAKPGIQQNSRVSGKKEKELWERIFILLSVFIGSISIIILIILGSIFWLVQGNTWNLSFTSNSIDLFANKLIITNTVAWIICIGGGFIIAIGTWSFRLGNLDTNTLDINGILYLAPVLSLVWLFPFGLIELQRWNYFIIGALIIVATSILIAIESNTGRLGFRWLIVSLWSTGLLIYFREKWIQWPWLSSDTPWEWNLATVDYYSLIVLSATIFILILSFRHTRLVERTNREEDQYLRMKHTIKYLDLYHNLDPYYKIHLNDCLDDLDQLDIKRGAEIRNKFVTLLNAIRVQIFPITHADTNTHADIKQLSDLELEFNLLYRSKQRGRYLAENLVLYIFALVTIMVTIGTRPIATSYWSALIIDVLAFLFSAAICFMTINLIDLRIYREKSTAELMDTEERGAREQESINQRAVQVISIILATVISVSFVVLLYDKWMGIWFL